MNRRTAHHVRAGVVIARADHHHLQDFAHDPTLLGFIERDLFRHGGPRNRIASLAYAVALDRMIRKARKQVTR